MLNLTNEKKASTLNSLSCYRTVRNLFMACMEEQQDFAENPAYTKGVGPTSFIKFAQLLTTPIHITQIRKTYEGRGKQYGEYESLHIGDTITVYYQKSNPSNSEAYVRNNKQQP